MDPAIGPFSNIITLDFQGTVWNDIFLKNFSLTNIYQMRNKVNNFDTIGFLKGKQRLKAKRVWGISSMKAIG